MKKISLILLALTLGVFAWQCKRDYGSPGSSADKTASANQTEPRSVYTPSGYSLVISADFNEASIDTTIWGFGSTSWGSETTSKKCAYIRPQDTYLSNGMLVERATQKNKH